MGQYQNLLCTVVSTTQNTFHYTPASAVVYQLVWCWKDWWVLLIYYSCLKQISTALFLCLCAHVREVGIEGRGDYSHLLPICAGMEYFLTTPVTI